MPAQRRKLPASLSVQPPQLAFGIVTYVAAEAEPVRCLQRDEADSDRQPAVGMERGSDRLEGLRSSSRKIC